MGGGEYGYNAGYQDRYNYYEDDGYNERYPGCPPSGGPRNTRGLFSAVFGPRALSRVHSCAVQVARSSFRPPTQAGRSSRKTFRKRVIRAASAARAAVVADRRNQSRGVL
jgi:hypothetical protein